MTYKFLDATANWSDPASTTYKYLRADGIWAAPDTEHKFLDAMGNWSAMELETGMLAGSWEHVAELGVLAATSPEEYQNYIGQEKTFKAGNRTFTAVLVDIGHYKLANGIGKCGFVFQTKEATYEAYKMNSKTTNTGGYPETPMYQTTLPTTILATFDTELQKAIVEVKIPYNTYNTNKFNIAETNAKLFLPSIIEVTGKTDYGNDGTQLAYWKQHNGASEYIKYKTGTKNTTDWWSRSCGSSKSSFMMVNSSGYLSTYAANYAALSVAPCFCVGQSIDYDLANYTWQEIADMSVTVAANPEKYQGFIGKEKTFSCLGSTFTAVCVDLAHFEKQDESGKAGFVFQFKETTSTNYPMNSTETNTDGYPMTDMYKTTLPNTIFTTMQNDLKNVIVEVKFPYNIYKGSGNGNSAFTIAETHAKLFLPSNREVWGTALGNESYKTGADGTRLAYWTQHTTTTEHLKYMVGTNTAVSWWCRSCYPNTSGFIVIPTGGAAGMNKANSATIAVAPCFCI